MRGRDHKTVKSAEPLVDRLRRLLPQPVDPEDDKNIQHLAEIVRAWASRQHELRDALLALKPKFLETHNWHKALEEIARDLGYQCRRTVERMLDPAPVAGDLQESEGESADATSKALGDTTRDEITATCVAVATERAGRWLRSYRLAETSARYTTRSKREALKFFPPSKKGPHPEAVGHLLVVAACMGVTAADLYRALSPGSKSLIP